MSLPCRGVFLIAVSLLIGGRLYTACTRIRSLQSKWSPPNVTVIVYSHGIDNYAARGIFTPGRAL